ncbi:MAG: sulfurtransferase complex subunit TusC [Gammaproteobacteria bacterium]|nr:sulfurtransferase complex subunit TusC [Gammaproteobacteria bacterium]
MDDESEGTIKKFMYINRKAPYGTVYALEALEVVLIAAAFDQDVSMVFCDDGVYQIVKGQHTKFIDVKNFSPTYRALEGYDVEKLYVSKESMDERGLAEDDLLVDVEIVDNAKMADLMEDQDVVLSF